MRKAASNAVKLLLAKTDASTADAIIAAFVKLHLAEYIISDDPHFEELGVKARKW